jgi:hypothetical protein
VDGFPVKMEGDFHETLIFGEGKHDAEAGMQAVVKAMTDASFSFDFVEVRLPACP